MYMSKLHTSRIVSIAASSMVATLGVAFLAYAATTISTNITTAGTLNADGASTLNAAVTLGDAIGDAVTFTGNATSSNNLYVTRTLTVGGNATTTGSSGLFITQGNIGAGGTTTPATSLSTAGSTYLGNATADTLTIHSGLVNFPISATSTMPASLNALTFATSSTGGTP